MSKFHRIAAVAISVAALFVFSVRLDGLIGGKVPQSEFLSIAAQALSLLGNGVTLAGVCGVFYLWGSISGVSEFKKTGRLGFFSLLLSGAAVQVLKTAFERPRIQHAADYVIGFLEHPALFDLTGKYNSFPSGHTAVSFALAYVLSRRHPRYALIFFLLAALVGASRVYLGSHYPSDITGGALLGICAGYLAVTEAKRNEKWLMAGLALLAVSMSFFKSGGFLVFDVDEAVFSEASREMVETGDLITPTYNYEPRYDKPILFYWFMSLAFKLFGVSEFAARFPSGFFGALLVMMTFFFIRHVKGLKPALFASLALLLNLEFFVYSHSAVTDMTLSFFISATFFSLYLAVHEGKKKWFHLAWAASALAVLTKGVIGALFPAAIGFIYLAMTRQTGRVRDFIRLRYIILFLVIAGPWFAAEFYVNGWDFFNAFIIKHHIKRYSDVISSHSGPFYYYIGVLLIGFFPWVTFLPNAIIKAFRERVEPSRGLELLCAVWFLFVLVFFSISRTKLPNYIFPLFTPAGILAGLYAWGLVERSEKRHGAYVLVALSALFAVALFILPSAGIKSDIPVSPLWFYFPGAVFAVMAVLGALTLKRPLPALIGLSGMVIVLIAFLRVEVLPTANIYLQKTLYDYGAFARNLGSDGVLATYEINKPSIAFYARRKFVKIEKNDTCNIKEFQKKDKFLLITSPSRLPELKEFTELKVIDQNREYVLLGTSGLPPFKKTGGS